MPDKQLAMSAGIPCSMCLFGISLPSHLPRERPAAVGGGAARFGFSMFVLPR